MIQNIHILSLLSHCVALQKMFCCKLTIFLLKKALRNCHAQSRLPVPLVLPQISEFMETTKSSNRENYSSHMVASPISSIIIRHRCFKTSCQQVSETLNCLLSIAASVWALKVILVCDITIT